MSEQPKPAEQQQQQQTPMNWRALLRPRGGQGEKSQLVRDLITVDKNLFGKTRIPNVFGMAVMGLLGVWSTPGSTFTVDLGNGSVKYDKTVFGLSQYFDNRYRVDAISAGGLSRQEYTTAALGYFLQGLEDIERTKESMLSEGSRQKKK